jgi:hypothetical protein
LPAHAHHPSSSFLLDRTLSLSLSLSLSRSPHQEAGAGQASPVVAAAFDFCSALPAAAQQQPGRVVNRLVINKRNPLSLCGPPTPSLPPLAA